MRLDHRCYCPLLRHAIPHEASYTRLPLYDRNIPDRSDTIDGQAFLASKRTSHSIFFDCRSLSLFCSIVFLSLTMRFYAHSTHTALFPFLIETCLNIFMINPPSTSSSSPSSSSPTSPALRRQETSVPLEAVSIWLSRLSKEIIYLGSQIHGPLGDASLPFSELTHSCLIS